MNTKLINTGNSLKKLQFNFTMFKFAFSSPVRPFTRKYPHGTFQLEFKETTINTSLSEASGNESSSTSMP